MRRSPRRGRLRPAGDQGGGAWIRFLAHYFALPGRRNEELNFVVLLWRQNQVVKPVDLRDTWESLPTCAFDGMKTSMKPSRNDARFRVALLAPLLAVAVGCGVATNSATRSEE